MAQQPAHYDTYREELGKKYPGFGYALWEPDPGSGKPPVEVGDVGFVRKGRFHRLFNALLPENHESHERFGVPEAHEPLGLTVTDHTSCGVLPPNTFHSHGVTVRPGGLEVLARSTIGSAEVSFSCTRNLGAAMTLPVTAQCEDTLSLDHFRKWMIKNIDAWFAFTQYHGLALDVEDIVFVTGRHRTKSWCNVVFTEVDTDTQFTLQVEVTGAPGASIKWRASSLQIQGAVLNPGPTGAGLPENQCIFLRGFRAKRIFGIFPRIKGAAEPEPDPRRDDCEQEMQVVPISSVTQYQDPLHVLLEYIASRAIDCHLALVHDSDLERILEVRDGTPLENLRPDVVLKHLQRSNLEIMVMSESDGLSTDDEDAGMDMAHRRVAMLSEQLYSIGPFDPQTSVPSLSDFHIDMPNSEQTNQSMFPLDQYPGYPLLTGTQMWPGLSPPINPFSPLATTSSNPTYRWQCPVCSAEFSRMQERKRHLITHLPPWIHCLYPHCSWTGHRADAFRRHWGRDHPGNNRVPGKKEFEIYDPLEFVDQVTAGTMTIDVAEAGALELIRAKADQLQKPSLLTKALDHKLRAGSSSQGSLSVEPNEPSMTEHDPED